MALNISLADEATGAICQYHKILTIEHYGAQVVVTLGSYPNEEARKAEKQPLIVRKFLDKDSELLTLIYNWLKELPEFKNTSNC